ncbi:AAA family ATPase [Polaromonas hydrogenivorans]|uniref:histidine kinase n=1 Tax=Polaromonas hydrogenivorans TaxID=335476 RepID=A0AAU7LRB3_9BURK
MTKLTPHAPATGRSSEDAAHDVLYQSETTRIYRQSSPTAAASVICKEPLGANALERLRHESKIIARLAGVEGVPRLAAAPHPANVMALEDCAGVPLVQAIGGQALELPALLALALQLTQTVAAMHRAGVLHQNINPHNILLAGPQRLPVLIGFRLATTFAEGQPGVTPHRDIAGKRAGLAPEQTGRTGHAVDQRADLYGIGATLYGLLTGRAPFENSDPLQLTHQLLAQLPTPPIELAPDTPLALSNLVMRLLEKAPDRRYQSAEGLAHDLRLLSDRLIAGESGAFALGRHDFAARLAPPARLVGRESELAGLKRAFEGALAGGARGVLVSGAPGVGKTALINELRPIVAARKGWFVAGKFDAQRQDLASDGVFQALRALGRLLLAEPEAELQALRARIIQTLGASGCRMAATVPEIALLLGEPYTTAESDPLTTQEQLVETTLDLVRLIASPERPLVMVIDDLQWAAPLPISFVHGVLTDDTLRGLLLVGAYRDAEVAPQHPLAAMLPRWARLNPPPLSLGLKNLPDTQLAALLAEMLKLAPPEAARLAQAVSARTGGNPFDTVQLIAALRRDGALVLGDDGWTWDARMIRHHIGQGDVIDLLTARIAALPHQTRELLGVMACLGGQVELQLLQAASGASIATLEQQLAAALEDGLLVMQYEGQPTVRFRHDRVQQASLDRLGPAQRGQLQLALARRLAVLPRFETTAAHQYLPVLEAIDNPAERLRAAHLLRRTASQLRVFNAAMAERFLSGALALLGRAGLSGAAQLPLHIERHALLYNLGRLGEADALYDTIKQGCDDPLQLADAACVQICSLTNQARPREAVALGQALLGRLGLALPSPEQLGAQLSQGGAVFSRWLDPATLAADLQRPHASDPRALAAGRLLNRMTPPSFFCDPMILASLVLAGQRLWTEHGPAAQFVGVLSHAAFISIGAWQDYRTGMAVVRRVMDVSEARGYHPEASQARFLFALGSGPWAIPLEDNALEAQRAHEGLLQGGDLQNACFTYYASVYSLLDSVPALERYAAEADAALAFSARTGNDHAAAAFVSPRQFARMLAGQTEGLGNFDDAVFNEAAHLASLGANLAAAANFHVTRALGAALAGDSALLIRQAAAAMPLLAAVPGTYLTAVAHLLQALALAERAKTAAPAQRGALLAELDACADWLRGRAADAPVNFSHLVKWIEAERAWACGERFEAAAAFDAALCEAAPRQRPWHNALIAERAALCLLAHGMVFSGRQMLTEAHQRYAAWGATAKISQLEQAHAFLKTSNAVQRMATGDLRESVPAATIDTLGIMRAAQALSSETNLERLRLRVVALLGEMTGATTVHLALWNEDAQQWLLPQPAQDGVASSLVVSEAAARGLLPLSVFRYAERTRKPLRVDDAMRDDRFACDPYLSGAEHCSLLVVPVLHHGAARAMLILENRLSRGAFTADRLDAVMLITGQLAVSLDNALQYEQLERRVFDRTRELREAQTQLVGAARQAGMAEIATNVLHNVGNILNSVNVSAALVGSTLRTSRAQGLSRAVQLMDEHAANLGDYLTLDEKGRLLPGYLGQLAQALAQEQKGMLEELGNLTRSIDHIKDVVATQQSYAGSASIVEPLQICDLAEDALRMSGQALVRHGVTVVREFAQVPVMPLDRAQVLLILVNLISNAKYAMENMADGSRRITLRVEVAGGALRLSVRDKGEGIAAENLTRIFAHGFTTRKAGHGFGLHSCALAARQMGGTLTAHSDGAGRGATFTLDLPIGAAQGAP